MLSIIIGNRTLSNSTSQRFPSTLKLRITSNGHPSKDRGCSPDSHWKGVPWRDSPWISLSCEVHDRNTCLIFMNPMTTATGTKTYFIATSTAYTTRPTTTNSAGKGTESTALRMTNCIIVDCAGGLRLVQYTGIIIPPLLNIMARLLNIMAPRLSIMELLLSISRDIPSGTLEDSQTREISITTMTKTLRGRPI